LVNLKESWDAIRKAADLGDLRIHHLRHSFVSVGTAGGKSLPINGVLLGHKETATTARYAHLSDNPLWLDIENRF
jgi:site-specific recombinase XerD